MKYGSRSAMLLLSLFIVTFGGLIGCNGTATTCPPVHTIGHTPSLIRITGFNNTVVAGTAGPLDTTLAFQSGVDNQLHSRYLISFWLLQRGYWHHAWDAELPTHTVNPTWATGIDGLTPTDSICVLLCDENMYEAGGQTSIASPYSNVRGIFDWDVVSTN